MHISGPSSQAGSVGVDGARHGRPQPVERTPSTHAGAEAAHEAVAHEITEVNPEVRDTIHKVGILQEALRVVEQAGAFLEPVL